MRIVSRLVSLWNTLVHRRRLDRDLDEELQSAIDTLTDRHRARGMDAERARRSAIQELGGVVGLAVIRQEVREGRTGAGFNAALLDLRYAWRTLAKAPGLAGVIVLTLALGIGSTVAIFSVVDAMLLEPLPYREADRLLFVWLDRSDVGYPRGPLSWPDLRDLRDGSRTCESFGGIWATGTVALTGDGDPEQLRGAFVTTNFFDVLGAPAALGRTFRPEDGAPGAAPTVLIGWDLFERRYGADASLVGRHILINDQSATVIGVMPRGFRLLLPSDSSVPDRLQVWVPLFSDVETWPRGSLFLRVIGRMRSSATLAEAREDIATIATRISRETGARRAFTAVGLQDDGVRAIRGPLLALFVGVGILMLIACVNVAGLLIARAAARARETAVRLALGASRGRLFRQSLIEGILLTAIGGAAGLLLAYLGLDVLVASTPESLSRLEAARIDTTVLVFTIGISTLWGLLFSLAPLSEVFKANARSTLSSGADRSTTLPIRYRARSTLVTCQVALSVVLLVSAGLLVRTVAKLQQVNPGYDSDRHLTFRIALPGSRYENAETQLAAARELQHRLAALRGVASVGAISHLPFDDLPNWGLTYAPLGVKDAAGSPIANARAVTPGLLETLGTELIDGRFITEHDRSPVVIIDNLLAERLWPGRSAVGQPFRLGQGDPDRRVIVAGVVRHLNIRSLVDDTLPQIFVPFAVWQRSPMAFVVRSSTRFARSGQAPPDLVADIRSTVAAFDPRLPIFDVRPLAAYVASARSVRQFTMWLAVVFAGTAFVLTCIGVYGVLAYAVASRRHEFGVRRALGADTVRVIREVLGEGARFAAIGCLGGVIGAAVAARLLQSQLYAVDVRDPLTYGVAVLLVATGATIACWIPARRATSISPMDALRGND